MDSDADTLYTLVAAKNINPDLFTICRSMDEEARVRLARIGAHKVVQPITVSGREIARDIILATNDVPYHTADLSFLLGCQYLYSRVQGDPRFWRIWGK